MADNPIPDDVLEFIDRTITSIDQLETLLLLKAHAERTWSAVQVSDELRSNPHASEDRLRSLAAVGLLQQVEGSDGTFRYAPNAAELDRVVTRLESCYREYRLRVIERVFKKPDGLQSFAEAFRIKKDRS